MLPRIVFWAATCLLAAALLPASAVACGGCLAPPGFPTLVRGHRMVLALTPMRTVLWDELSWAGDPREFSWIFPVQNADRVQLHQADPRFFQLLDDLYGARLLPPTAFASGNASGSFDDPVRVLREETVGPYAVVFLRGTDPTALHRWLSDRGYAVHPNISVILERYVQMRSDFIAVRLRPGEGVQSMTPLRITMTGYQPWLPLQMIAAGTADQVSLVLTVLASTRMRIENFPNAQICDREFFFDARNPTNPTDDFARAIERMRQREGRDVWLTESALYTNRDDLLRTALSYRRRFVLPFPPSCERYFECAVVPDCDEPDVLNDARIAVEGLGRRFVITRMSAELALADLQSDLKVSPSFDGERGPVYGYHEVFPPSAAPFPWPECNATRGPLSTNALDNPPLPEEIVNAANYRSCVVERDAVVPVDATADGSTQDWRRDRLPILVVDAAIPDAAQDASARRDFAATGGHCSVHTTGSSNKAWSFFAALFAFSYCRRTRRTAKPPTIAH